MTTVAVKVWDKQGGRKFTRKFYLTVNKGIAPSVKEMFKEIYKSKERFQYMKWDAITGVETVQHQNIALDLPLTSTQMKIT